MLVLLDERLPRQLARNLVGHRVRTVQQCGWAGLRNGALLMRAAANAYEVFLTADQNLAHQQNIPNLPLAVIVLGGQSNALEDLLPLVPAVLTAIRAIRAGEVRTIDAP